MFRARGRFRRRRGSTRFRRNPVLRAKTNFHTVNIAARTLAAATSEVHTLITADDTPSPVVVSTGSGGTVAECEEGAVVKFRKLKVQFTGAFSDPVAVAFAIWKDQVFGGLADLTSAEDIVAPSTTTSLKVQKASVGMYRKFWLTPNSDNRVYSLYVPRRLAKLRQGESLKMIVTNLEAATDAIEYFVQGTIISVG